MAEQYDRKELEWKFSCRWKRFLLMLQDCDERSFGKEIWKPTHITGYEVSNFGRVRNTNTFRIMKPFIHKNGYSGIKICDKHVKPHILVAQAFIPNPKNKPDVDHIVSSNRICNHVLNLRWVTPEESNMNTGMLKNNTSGVKGVVLEKRGGKKKDCWQAYIEFGGKKIKKRFKFEEKHLAIQWRKDMVKKYYGEYANYTECDLFI